MGHGCGHVDVLTAKSVAAHDCPQGVLGVTSLEPHSDAVDMPKTGTSADRKRGEEEAFERHNDATELGTLWAASKQKTHAHE